MDPVLKEKVGILVHHFLLREIEQFDLVRQGKLRTDNGYQSHLETLAEAIIKTTHEHNSAKA